MASSKKALGILFGVKGGSSISQGSGALILQDLKKIVNQVNNNNKLLPKVELRFDVSDAIKSINKLQKALNSLQKQTKNINIPNGSKGGAKSSVYTQNLAEAKKYFKELKALQKAAVRTKDVDVDKSGNILGIHGDNYQNHYKYYQELEKKYKRLTDVIGNTKLSTSQQAQALNLTINEYEELSQVIGELQKQAGISFDKIKIDATAAWQKQASNVSDSIHRVYDTISKDPAVKNLADDILEMTKQGSGNVEELKQKFQEFNLKARQSGADIETWGQKFKKTFANQVRSALASLITVDVGQILKGVYDNVVALDDAVVNLQIASGKSRTETKALVKEYAALAKQLKATTAEVSASADTWLRQGYSAKEAETLITNSMMLSKLGQIESEEAATALTSAMKGYKVAVEDTVNIVDKLTAVDMEAAASAGGIATAMAETAAGAGLAGVSMDKLIGYLAVVKEVTQDADESVGVFFRTLFSRMGNIKAGKFVDDDGESLNDVESVLGKLGIKLRNSNDDFRDFSDVLDEVGQKWDSFSETEKNAIASAMAGTRQREKLIVLMDNYGTSLKYAATAAESAGTATQKYEAYTEGITGKINGVVAAFERLSLNVLDSDWLGRFMDSGANLIDIIANVSTLIDKIGGLNSVISIAIGLWTVIESKKIVKQLDSIPVRIKNITSSIKALTTGAASATLASQALVGGLAVAATTIITVLNAVSSAQQRAIANNLDIANSHTEAAQAACENAMSLAQLIERYEELAQSRDDGNIESVEEIRNIQEQIVDLIGDQGEAIDLVNGKLQDQKTILEGVARENIQAYESEIDKALAAADTAYHDKANHNLFFDDSRILGMGKDRNDLFKSLAEQFHISKTQQESIAGTVYGIKFRFDDIEDFISQYESVDELLSYLAQDGRYKLDKSHNVIYEVASKYISDYKEVYESYTRARKAKEELNNKIKNWEESGNTGDNTITTPTDDQIVETLKHTEEELNALLDRYKELIELRKELLKTYAKELEYQKELEKKQQKAASLQTKLAIARLDDSAAGQARVRELEAQLEEAQNDLEDFTLEHAIEEIIEGIDHQYIEYEAFISAEIDKITKKIDELKDGKPPEDDHRDSFDERALLYELKQAMNADIRTDRERNDGANVQTIRNHYKAFWDAIMYQANQGKYDIALELFDKIMTMRYPMLNMYHTGGFVGGVPTLANNEEFAKLLEGEFVSTPSQIKNFMTRTLPQLTSFNSSGGHEFHAPLVEIKCESVTSESMPKLKEIVDEAVGEIKRCLDGGMSRTGYKRSVKKLLT